MAFSTTVNESAGAESAQSRDPIASLLFYKMEWCERHPGVMLACLGVLAVVGSLLEKVLP